MGIKMQIVKSIKPLTFILILLGLSLFLSACKSVNNAPLKVGMVPDHAPWENKISENKASGISVDLVNDFSKYSNRAVTIVWLEQDQLFKSLASGEIDCILSSTAITEDYQNTYLVSDPYIKTYPILLIRKDSPVASKNQLNLESTTIAVITPSKSADMAKSEYSNATILGFTSRSTALDSLISGKCDAFIDDPLSVFDLYSHYPTDTKLNPAPLTDKFQYYAVFMPLKSESLKAQWNEFFSNNRKTDYYKKLEDIYVKPYQDIMTQYNITITL